MRQTIHLHIDAKAKDARTGDGDPYTDANPAAIAHIQSLCDRAKSTAKQGFSKAAARKAAKALTDAIDAMLYERD